MRRRSSFVGFIHQEPLLLTTCCVRMITVESFRAVSVCPATLIDAIAVVFTATADEPRSFGDRKRSMSARSYFSLEH